MKDITYLIGAGASAHTLPVVKNMPERIGIVAKIFEEYSRRLTEEQIDTQPIPKGKTNIDLCKQLSESLRWIEEKASDHASIDTYAKKLSIGSDKMLLRKLKITLSVYFTVDQAQYGYDKRYDTFFASIIDKNGIMPNKLRILSWNYDSQFEMAFGEFNKGIKDLYSNSLTLNIKTKNHSKRNTNGFSILKLNGTSGFHFIDGHSSEYFADEIVKLNDDLLKEVLIKYGKATYSPELTPSISFAWEPEIGNHDSITNLATDVVKNTNVLVVIGYSFPFFNREIDRLILNGMPYLQKIYYQDKLAHQLDARLQSIREEMDGIEVVPYTDVDQFFLPYEL